MYKVQSMTSEKKLLYKKRKLTCPMPTHIEEGNLFRKTFFLAKTEGIEGFFKKKFYVKVTLLLLLIDITKMNHHMQCRRELLTVKYYSPSMTHFSPYLITCLFYNLFTVLQLTFFFFGFFFKRQRQILCYLSAS